MQCMSVLSVLLQASCQLLSICFFPLNQWLRFTVSGFVNLYCTMPAIAPGDLHDGLIPTLGTTMVQLVDTLMTGSDFG